MTTRSSSDGLRVRLGVKAANADRNREHFDDGHGITICPRLFSALVFLTRYASLRFEGGPGKPEMIGVDNRLQLAACERTRDGTAKDVPLTAGLGVDKTFVLRGEGERTSIRQRNKHAGLARSPFGNRDIISADVAPSCQRITIGRPLSVSATTLRSRRRDRINILVGITDADNALHRQQPVVEFTVVEKR